MIEFLSPSFLLALIILAVVWLSVGRPGNRYFLPMMLFGGLLMAIASNSAIFVLQILFIGGLLFFCRLIGVGVGSRRLAAVMATVAAFALVIHNNVEQERQNAQRLAALRMQYPLQSISERLKFETRKTSTAVENVAAAVETAAPIVLTEEVEAELASAEAQSRATARAASLRQLHEAYREPTGQPSSRTSLVSLINQSLALPASRSISLSEPIRRGGCDHESTTPPVEYQPQPAPSDSTKELFALRAFHRDGVEGFLDPDRFGLVQDLDHVAGFEPHAFQNMPKLDMPHNQKNALTIKHVNLVSLRKPSGPHVYVSENLPKMDELKTADTRLIDDFETRALTQLRTDTDIVIEESHGVVRMLGSLRAGNHCIRCHSVERGELLGALSYEWHREDAPEQVVLSD